jgi:hypothetical protein
VRAVRLIGGALALLLVACGGGGGAKKGGPAAAAAGHPDAAASADAGASGSTVDTGPPSAAGNGHRPANAGAGGATAPTNPGDRDPTRVRSGKWKITDMSGEIVAQVAAPCASTSVAYNPALDKGFLNLTGDGRVKFQFAWLRPGATFSGSTTTPANEPPPWILANDPPDGSTAWTQAGIDGKSGEGALTLSSTFDTPSQLVGKWQYAATAVGSCGGQAHGQGTFTAAPS